MSTNCRRFEGRTALVTGAALASVERPCIGSSMRDLNNILFIKYSGARGRNPIHYLHRHFLATLDMLTINVTPRLHLRPLGSGGRVGGQAGR